MWHLEELAGQSSLCHRLSCMISGKLLIFGSAGDDKAAVRGKEGCKGSCFSFSGELLNTGCRKCVV